MTDEQIKRMVDRFLTWKLPADFSPDNGISFEPEYTTHPWPTKARREPVGTNLLTATQAEAMVRYIVGDLPEDGPALRGHLAQIATDPDCCAASKEIARHALEA